MSRTKQRSILWPIVAALLALTAFGSLPYFLSAGGWGAMQEDKLIV